MSNCTCGSQDEGSGHGREAGHPRPVRAMVGAAPQPGIARTEEQHAAVVRIHRQPLAVATAQLVAAELERQVDALEAAPLVMRAQDGGVDRLCAGVHACGEVQPLRIGRIDGEAVDPEQVLVLRRDPVGQRLPATAGLVPAICAAHVGACVVQVAHRRVEEQTGDIAATTDAHVGEVVGNGGGLTGVDTRREEQGAGDDADVSEHAA